MAKKKKVGRKQTHRKKNSGINTEFFPSLYGFEITEHPIEDLTVPDELEGELEQLFYQLQEAPQLAVERLTELIYKYPDVPKLYNFISVAYSQLGDREKAKLYIMRNYEYNPENLFARLNYAEICIVEKNYEKIPEILNGQFDIKAMYPKRTVFHVSEVVGFMGVVGLYFAETGMISQAEQYLENIELMSPRHPFAVKLRQRLLINSVREGFNKLIGGK